MICVMSSPATFSTIFIGKRKKGFMFSKLKKEMYALAQFYELFQVLQEFSTQN